VEPSGPDLKARDIEITTVILTLLLADLGTQLHGHTHAFRDQVDVQRILRFIPKGFFGDEANVTTVGYRTKGSKMATWSARPCWDQFAWTQAITKPKA